jgi:hypothetical protein
MLVVSLGLLAFGGYLMWYGLRSRVDSEPLSIAAGVVPFGAVLLGVFLGKRVHVVVGVLTPLLLLTAAVGFTYVRTTAIAERDAEWAAARDASRVALAVCAEGTPLPGAPAYVPGPTVTMHVFGSVYGDAGRPIEWLPWRAETYPPGWFGQGPPQLVACLRNRYSTVESQVYSGANGAQAFVSARQHHYDVEVLEASTLRSVFRTELLGGAPPSLASSIRVTGSQTPRDQDGSRVSDQAVIEALRPLVGH